MSSSRTSKNHLAHAHPKTQLHATVLLKVVPLWHSLNTSTVGIMKSQLCFTAKKHCCSNVLLHCQLCISFLQALTGLVRKTWP